MYDMNTGPSPDFLARLKMIQGMQNPMQNIGMGPMTTLPSGQVPPMGSGDANSYGMPPNMPGPMIDTAPQGGIRGAIGAALQRMHPPAQQPIQKPVMNKPQSPFLQKYGRGLGAAATGLSSYLNQ